MRPGPVSRHGQVGLPRAPVTQQVQPGADSGPVDDQVLTQRPHRWPAPAVIIPAPQRFSAPRTAEVPRRPRIPRGRVHREPPLCRNPALRDLYPGGDQLGRRVVDPWPIHPHRPLSSGSGLSVKLAKRGKQSQPEGDLRPAKTRSKKAQANEAKESESATSKAASPVRRQPKKAVPAKRSHAASTR